MSILDSEASQESHNSMASSVATAKVLLASSRLTNRTGTIAAKLMRQQGFIPGSMYGGGGSMQGKDRMLMIPERDVLTELRARGQSIENTLYKLRFNEDEDDEHVVLVRQLQMHAFRNQAISCNFVRYDPAVGARIEVPVFFSELDSCVGIKRGGMLNQIRWRLKLHVKGDVIPSAIPVACGQLDVGQKVYWRDLGIPEDGRIRLITQPNQGMDDVMICNIRGKKSLEVDDDDADAPALAL